MIGRTGILAPLIAVGWLGGCGTTPADPAADAPDPIPPVAVGSISAEYVQTAAGGGRLSTSALFLRGAQAQPVEAEVFGACTVVGAPSGTSSDGRSLDAGAATVSNGTAEVELARVSPGNYAAFEDLTGSGFVPGQTLSYRFDGGADVDPFAVEVALPPVVMLTAPDLEVLATGAATDVDIAWIPAPGGYDVAATWFAADGDARVTVECDGPDAGSLTVPAAALMRLPTDRAAATFSIARVVRRDLAVELRDGTTGIVQVTALSRITRVATRP